MASDNQKGLQCQHHYMLDPPKKKTSWGKCKYCGDEKEFSNLPDLSYQLGYRSGRKKKDTKRVA